MRNILAIAAITASISLPGHACPSYVSAQGLKIPAGTRRELRLFALTADQGGRRWQSLPVQADPLDEGGVLKSVATATAAAQLISPLDRIVLRQEGFGPRLTGDAAPCDATHAVELSDPTNPERFAYLTVCAGAPASTLAQPVHHDPDVQKITGPRFEYEYQKNNQLMYRTLYAKSPRWQDKVLAGADADLHLHLDIRKFFTIDFTNKDVQSFVGSTSTGPVGMVGSMDFFLHLLFFKINLKMGTTVGFYADSAHIPAMIDVPRDAPKMLHPGSGILYVWAKENGLIDAPKVQGDKASMPIADPKIIREGWEKTAIGGLPYCHDGLCTYRLSGKVSDEHFGLDINVPRTVAERGFYPQWVGDVAAFKRTMGWDVDAPAAPNTVAVFFDNSGLLKGQYRLDQWLRIGEPKDLATRCPRPVTIGNTVKFGPDGVAH